jgi:hypothetical protein
MEPSRRPAAITATAVVMRRPYAPGIKNLNAVLGRQVE